MKYTKCCKWCGLRYETDSRNKTLCSKECKYLDKSFRQLDEHSIYRDMLKAARKRSRKTGKSCTITLQDIKHLWEKQAGVCCYTGEKLSLGVLGEDRGKRGYTTASLDRIDSAGDYTVDNIQIVHVVVNYMKHVLSHEEFLRWCGKVISNLDKLNRLTG